MEDVFLFISIIMAGLAGLLLIVSFASWYRLRNIKLFFVSLAFLAFLIKAVLLIFEIIIQDDAVIIIDFVILFLLYFSVVKK